MALDKRNISISFGQGLDTRTDPKQVVPGKMLALYNATLLQNLNLLKRNGYQPISSFTTPVASSSLTNAKLGVFNNQLLCFDGKTLQVDIAGDAPQLVDNFLAIQPTVTTVAREVTALINQDAAYNQAYMNTAYVWSSSCIAPNFQQLSFRGATGKFQITSPNGTVLASTGIVNFTKNRVFSFGNNFYWTGINYPSSTLQYLQIPANGTSANFNNIQTVGTGAVGGDFQANPLNTGFNRYQRYDGAVLADNLYIGWFQPATSAINISLITVSGVTQTVNFKADASGALGVFGDRNYVWVVYHDGATSAGFAVFNTSALGAAAGPAPFFATDAPAAGNGFSVDMPQYFTGTSNSLAARVYTHYSHKYPNTQYSGVPSLPWKSLERSDYIGKWAINGVLNATSGSSAVVARSVGLGSKAWNYLGDDYLVASYGGTQTSSSADRLEPTYFVLAPTKASNNIVGKLAFQNGAGYDLQTGGQGYYLNNNYGSVGYGLPLPHVFQTPSQPTQFTVPYLVKTGAVTLSSTSLAAPYFISYNFGVNSATLDFNTSTLFNSVSYGNSLNIAGGYLANFDGKSVNEQNFHLFPEDVQLLGSSSMGPAANTYAYQVIYEHTDAQGNIFRSAPSKTYSITTAGSSAVYALVPTCRLTNKKGVNIRLFRNAPSIDPLTFHDTAPLNPTPNNPNIDNVVILDTNTDAQLIGNPSIYTTGGILENTGAPSPLWITTYKLRVMALDAETNTWWYSKEVLPGTPVEMTDLQTFAVSTKYGNSTCGIEMDDKFILFTRSPDGSLGAIYYMVGEGPAANGQNNDFSLPNLISSTITTNNPNSVVLMPNGVMFQSDKGIWILDRGLNTQYIGADVQSFNDDKVTSALVVPNTTQVRFTLQSGVCLVWDYFQSQWSVFSNINATHGIIYQGLFTYLNQNFSQARVLQETPNQYVDISSPVLMSLTTSWLSLAGLQGFQRAYKLFLLGESKSPHLLNVSVAYDFNSSPVQTAVIRPLSNANGTWGSDPYWGANLTYGGYSQLEQFRINLTRQKCQAIQLTIQESLDPNKIAYGAGPVLEAIGVVVGGKLTYPKLPSNQSVK